MSKEKWWKNSFIDRRTFLLESYAASSFNDNDMMLILMMDLMMEKNHKIEIEELATALKRSEGEVMTALNSLSTEGWIQIDVTSKSICYSLDPIFDSKPVVEVNQTLFDKFEEQMRRPLSSKEINTLGSWMQQYDEEIIEAALREAVIYKKLSFAYINKILENWRLQNRTIEDINNAK